MIWLYGSFSCSSQVSSIGPSQNFLLTKNILHIQRRKLPAWLYQCIAAFMLMLSFNPAQAYIIGQSYRCPNNLPAVIVLTSNHQVIPGSRKVVNCTKGDRLFEKYGLIKNKNGDYVFNGMTVTDVGYGTTPDPRGVASTQTNTSLSFIAGTAGNFSLANYGVKLYASDEYLVPNLFNEANDLYVGIDLTEWLLNPAAFDDGYIFQFVNGKSASLPGFVVGTSEITFSADKGWGTENPFDGL